MTANEGATLTIQQQWDRFERWIRRLQTVSEAYLEQLGECDTLDADRLLYSAAWYEWAHRDDADPSVISSAAPFRLAAKIRLIRAYFRDVSFDGPEFMKHYASFLTHQYPSRCNSAYAVWFDQGDEPLEPQWQLECALFLPSVDAVDYFSIMEIMAFEVVRIRAPRGAAWTKSQIRGACERIQTDMADDGLEVEIKPRRRGRELLELSLVRSNRRNP